MKIVSFVSIHSDTVYFLPGMDFSGNIYAMFILFLYQFVQIQFDTIKMFTFTLSCGMIAS